MFAKQLYLTLHRIPLVLTLLLRSSITDMTHVSTTIMIIICYLKVPLHVSVSTLPLSNVFTIQCKRSNNTLENTVGIAHQRKDTKNISSILTRRRRSITSALIEIPKKALHVLSEVFQASSCIVDEVLCAPLFRVLSKKISLQKISFSVMKCLPQGVYYLK